jgi:hypothetical protein
MVYDIRNGGEMKQISSRTILPVLTAALGILWTIVGFTQYGWFEAGRPLPGFFPIIVGVLTAGVSILAVLRERKASPPQFLLTHLYPLLAAVGVVLLAMLIGFFPALTLYVFGWLKGYEKYSWKFSVLSTAVTIGGVYGIFALWLKVPFPMGSLVMLVLY